MTLNASTSLILGVEDEVTLGFFDGVSLEFTTGASLSVTNGDVDGTRLGTEDETTLGFLDGVKLSDTVRRIEGIMLRALLAKNVGCIEGAAFGVTEG